MRRGVIGLIALVAIGATMLQGGINVEEQAFVTSMGVERMEDARLRVSLQIPVAGMGGGEAGQPSSSGAGGYLLVDSVAHTFQDALERLTSAIPRYLNFSQMLQVAVSEALAREPDFVSVMGSLLSAKNIRQSAIVVVCQGSAHEFVKTQEASWGVRLADDIQTSLILFYNQEIIPSMTLGEVIRAQNGAYRDMLLPYSVITPLGGDYLAQPSEMGRPLDTAYHVLTTDVISHIEYLGAAIFRDGQMIGTLTGMEMQFISHLQGNPNGFTFYVDGTYYKVRPILPPRISVDTRREQWRFSISSNLHASAIHAGGSDMDALRDAFNRETLNVLSKLQALGADPIGFQGKAVRSVSTMEAWSRRDWMKAYQNAVIALKTGVMEGEAE